MSYTASPDLAAFVQSLPKTETHLHMEGALPFELIQALDPVRYAEAPKSWADDYRFKDLEEFLVMYYEYAGNFFTSAERYHQAAKIIFQKIQSQNGKYVETSFHLGVLEFMKDSGPDVIEAIRSAAPAGLEVRVYAGFVRNDYPQLKKWLDEIHTWEGLAGVDHHGTETLPILPWSEEVWAKCAAAGKLNKCHAGESDGPHRVREAIEKLKVNRIEHGVRSIEDPAVLQLLKDHGVTLDICPISNLKIQIVPSLKQHTIRQLFDAGVRCTVSTDDPFFFGNTLNEEYFALASDLNFTKKELAQIARYGFEASTLSAEQKQTHLAEIDRIVSTLA
jgi:adenosine deaminase